MKQVYLEIAKEAIADRFYDREKIVSLYPELGEYGATFVALNLNGGLRGCMGSTCSTSTSY